MGEAREKDPLDSNNSAVREGPFESLPPAIRIRPTCNSTAAAPLRAEFIAPATIHVPLGTLNGEAPNKLPVAVSITAQHTIVRMRLIEEYAPLTKSLRARFHPPIGHRGNFGVHAQASSCHASETACAHISW